MDNYKPVFRLNDCYNNAYTNCRYFYKDKKLKLVIGSLGINNWFEYGGKDWSLNDFKKKMSDSHCWLEDDEGRVYDYLFEDYSRVSLIRTGKKLERKGVVEAVKKSELLEDGIEYIPASKEVQTLLFLNFYGKMKLNESIYLKNK